MSEQPPPDQPSPEVRRRRLIVIASSIAAVVIVAVVVGFVVLAPKGRPAPTPSVSSPSATPTPSPTPSATPTPIPTPTPDPEPTFDPGAFSIDDPNSLWVVVNKQRPLNPADYYPPDLRAPQVPYGAYDQRTEAATAVEQMFAAFLAETGQEMESISGFRSYDSQVSTYNGWVNQLGQAQADLVSARPGHSEHQTGLAIDIASVPANCSLEECFAQTAQAQWAAANAYRFGFILRYPADKTPITGYAYEPWHFRYVGVALATEMHDTGVTTLEEYFGLPAAPSY
jgi:D-alanyl-D-alanine carboxypeptidase